MPSRFRSWRLYSLTAVAAALLAACGGGEEDNTGGTGQPQACFAPNQATAAPNTQRLLVKLHADAALPTPNRTPSASAQKLGVGGAPLGADLLPGLRLRKVSQFGGVSAAKASAGATSPAAPLRFASVEITDPSLSTEQAMQRLKDSGLAEYVEPDVRMKKSRLPVDNLFASAWHLKNTGQYGAGTAGIDIGAESAWNRGVGTGATVVAVVDDGVRASHPDLAANMWRNSREIAGNNLDDDGNGLVDDVHGADMVLGHGDIEPYFPRVDSDHGTMVAGVIAAKGSNTEGSTGVIWNTQIMALKIEGPASSEYSLLLSDFVDAFNYILTQKARGVNVRVINVSYGTDANSNAYREVIAAAGNQGILVVVPTGNEGTSDAFDLGYPANWQLPNVLAVGAIGPNGARSCFSNFGPLANLYAPGEIMVTTSMFANGVNDGTQIAPGYRAIDGTSFSAPVVAGAAALLMDTYPSASMQAVRARLLASATPFGPAPAGVPQMRLNLAAAIASAP